MKLPESQIELAASTEESRYTTPIKAVKLDVAGKRLMATDGRILAIVPAEVSEQDHDGLIPVDALKEARKMDKASKGITEIAVNGKFTVNAGNRHAEFKLETGNFPNADAVIPKFDGPPTITLDAELLLRLAKAIQTKGYSTNYAVALWVKDANSAILVKGEQDGAIGVLMPCRGKHTPNGTL